MHKTKIVRFSEVDSTNRIAFELGLQGAVHGTVIHAKQQSQGRGRKERPFVSPPGGLYISIIIRPDLSAKLVPLTTLAAGVACCQTVEHSTGLRVQLKWPNDLYVKDKKLAGILTESAPFSAREGKIPFLVVGIGLNVITQKEMFPPSLRESVTSLYCIQNKRYDPDLFIPGIVDRLDKFVADMKREKEYLFSYWQHRDYLFGKKIGWKNPTGNQLSGYGAGLHEDGCYRLKDSDNKIHYIVGGELSLVSSGRIE